MIGRSEGALQKACAIFMLFVCCCQECACARAKLTRGRSFPQDGVSKYTAVVRSQASEASAGLSTPCTACM